MVSTKQVRSVHLLCWLPLINRAVRWIPLEAQLSWSAYTAAGETCEVKLEKGSIEDDDDSNCTYLKLSSQSYQLIRIGTLLFGGAFARHQPKFHQSDTSSSIPSKRTCTVRTNFTATKTSSQVPGAIIEIEDDGEVISASNKRTKVANETTYDTHGMYNDYSHTCTNTMTGQTELGVSTPPTQTSAVADSGLECMYACTPQ